MSHPLQQEFDAKYVGIHELESELEVTRQTIWNYRKQGKIPECLYFGKSPVWLRSELEPCLNILKGNV